MTFTFFIAFLGVSAYRVNINLKLTPKLVAETGKLDEIRGVLICRS